MPIAAKLKRPSGIFIFSSLRGCRSDSESRAGRAVQMPLSLLDELILAG
tara:strand:- start:46768 stop:46914 length:147 start_codon:yes stop_codon:yes gene_type:complete